MLIIFRDKRELKTPKITFVISNKKCFFFYHNGYCPTFGTPIHMDIIASYPKHIKFGEERIQFILVTYTTRVVMKMVTLIICFVWLYNVVKHCNRTDFVLKGSFLVIHLYDLGLFFRKILLHCKYFIVAIANEWTL